MEFLSSIDVQSPLFIFGWGILAAVLGWIGKTAVDFWTNETKIRQDFASHVIEQIERVVPSYHLMSNFAYLLSNSINQYTETKRRLQIAHIDDNDTTSLKSILENNLEFTSKRALFYAGKLYAVITKCFWTDGGKYFLPDKWAEQAIENLHNGLMVVLHFEPTVLLKYISIDTNEQEFYDKLKLAENKDKMKDLHDAYVQYREWIFKNDNEVNQLVAYARAYSDLFSQQMVSLYQNWYKRRLWGNPPDDSRKAKEVKDGSSILLEETRELIKRSADQMEEEKQKQSSIIMNNITATPKDVEFNAHLKLGWNYYFEKQYDLAIKEYLSAKEIKPDSYVLLNNLGNAYTNKKDYESATSMYENSINLAKKEIQANPKDLLIQENMAIFYDNSSWMYYKRGIYDKAIEFAKKAIELKPQNMDYYYNNIGNAYSKMKEWDKSIQAYMAAIAFNPYDPILYDNLGASYRAQKNYDASIQAYEKAIELNQNEASYNFEIGEIRKMQNQWDQAALMYERALEKAETNTQYALELIVAQTKSGKGMPQKIMEKAQHAFQKALSLEPYSAIHHYRFGQFFFQLGEYERALNEYDNAVRLSPNKADYWNQLGLTYRRLNRWEMAVRSYKEAINLNSESSDYYRNLGLGYQAMKRYDDALIPLETAINKGREDFDILLSLAEVFAYGSQHDIEKAKKSCTKAIEKKPDSYLPYILLGGFLRSEGDYANSIDNYKKAIAHNPNEKDKKDILKGLIRTYREVIGIDQSNPELYFNLGRTYEELEMMPESMDAFEKALELDTGNPTYQAFHNYISGMIYLSKGNLQSAIDTLENVIKIAPQSPLNFISVHSNLGQAYDRMNKTNEALDHYEQAAKLDPKNYEAHYKLGLALYRQDQITRALSEFQEALRLRPDQAPSVCNIGSCYYSSKYFDLAEEKWLAAIKLNPQLSEAFYNLGVLSYMQNDKESAEKRWHEAAKSNNGLAVAYQNLGITSFERGNNEAAIANLQKAFNIDRSLESVENGIEAIKRGESPNLRINSTILMA